MGYQTPRAVQTGIFGVGEPRARDEQPLLIWDDSKCHQLGHSSPGNSGQGSFLSSATKPQPSCFVCLPRSSWLQPGKKGQREPKSFPSAPSLPRSARAVRSLEYSHRAFVNTTGRREPRALPHCIPNPFFFFGKALGMWPSPSQFGVYPIDKTSQPSCSSCQAERSPQPLPKILTGFLVPAGTGWFSGNIWMPVVTTPAPRMAQPTAALGMKELLPNHKLILHLQHKGGSH